MGSIGIIALLSNTMCESSAAYVGKTVEKQILGLHEGSVFTTRKTSGSLVIRNKVTGKLRMRRYDKRNEIKRCQTKLKGTKLKQDFYKVERIRFL